MKKTLIAALVVASMSAYAGDNWTSANGQPIKNSTGLCWRDANWTPATAHPDCDGALKPVVKPVTVQPAVAPTPKAFATPASAKTTFSSDALFDFDKSVLNASGKKSIDLLLNELNTMTLEVVIVVGHTDSVGSESYNEQLGLKRAKAVKAYLVSRGIDQGRIYTDSKGEKQPVASNKTRDGRMLNRRVVVEVVGTVKK